MRSIALVASLLWIAASLPAQLPPQAPVPGRPRPSLIEAKGGAPAKAATPLNVIGFTATPLGEVLEEYHRVTGRRVLRDKGLEAVTVSIEVAGEFTDAEYLDIIEKGLLMHGYALVPSGDNLFKLVAAEGGSMPSTQHVPMILRAEDLPKTDQVVTHVVQLQHLQPDETAIALQQIIPPHSYGKIVAVPNAQALIITEASQTIRAYVELIEHVDLPAAEVRHKTIHLERADAEEVAVQLETLLGLKSANETTKRLPVNATMTAAMTPQQRAAAAAAEVSAVTNVNGGSAEAQPPKIQSIARTNSILVVARPVEMEYIESLVKELDGESPSRGFVSRALNYIDLTTFLNIATKALMRNNADAAEAANAPTSNPTTTTSTQQVGSNNGPFNGGFGRNGGGAMSGGYGGGYGRSLSGGGLGGGFGSEGAAAELDITKKATSALIGKTLVIVDPASSKFFASGPPEELRMLNDLADALDVRPRQIFLSAIVGEFTLGDDFSFGLDWIHTLRKVGDDSLVGGILNTQGTAFADLSTLGGVGDFIGENGPALLPGLTAYGQIGKYLNVFLRTLEQTNRFQVLQKPTLTTLNHQPASIYIGQQIAIAGQTYTAGGVGGVNNGLGFTSTTEYIPVRLQIDITPHIYNDREVMLEFKQQNNDVSGFTTISGNRVPNISEQGMQNSLIVPDGTAAMLGGLITERDSKDKTGLPFLVRVPILKHLFGSTSKSKSRKELMIFVQPHIMSNGLTHIETQSEWAKKNESYTPVLEFAKPPDEPPIEAQEAGVKRSTKGAASPLLPLPNWDIRDISSGKETHAVQITVPKAQLVEDPPPAKVRKR